MTHRIRTSLVLLIISAALPLSAKADHSGFYRGYISHDVTPVYNLERQPAPGSFFHSVDFGAAGAAVQYNDVRVVAVTDSPTTGQQFSPDSALAQGSFVDQVTIEAPGLDGQPGSVVFEFRLAGSISASGGADPDVETFAEYNYQIKVGVVVSETGRHRVNTNGTTTGEGGNVLNQNRQLTTGLEFSQPIGILWDNTNFARTSRLLGSAANVQTQFSMRVLKVLDRDGKEVTNYTVRSHSGVDYTGTTGLWAAGRDLARNERFNPPEETAATNATVPQWSYGYRDVAASTAMTLFTPAQHLNNASQPYVDGWDSGGDAGVTLIVNTSGNNVTFNFGLGDLKPLFPEQIAMDPSQGGTLPVVRWTAPAAGRYNVVARWVDLDPYGGNGVSCHMVKNGTSLFNADIDNGGLIDMPVQAVDVNAGDTIDFLVGSRGDFSFDTTGFNAAISLAPAVTITSPATKTQLEDGQDVTVNVAVTGANQAAAVQLRDNGKVIGTDTEAPYEFTVPDIESGAHRLTAVAVDERGVESASQDVELTVVQSGGATARKNGKPAAGGQVGKAASSGYSYFFNAQSGSWDEPNNWFRLPDFNVGVPGPDDDAYITYSSDGGTTGAVVTINRRIEVKSLVVGSVNKLMAQPGSLRFEVGVSVRNLADLSDADLEGFELFIEAGAELTQKYENRFTNMVIFNNGDITYTGPGKTIADSLSEMRNNGSINVQRQPGSNQKTELLIGQIQQNGRLSMEHNTRVGTNGLINTGTALIGMDGASILSQNGMNIISRDGAGLIGMDGASIISRDGASLIGPDGASLIGMDGASLAGRPGATYRGRPSKGGEARQEAATAPVSVVVQGGTLGGTGNIVGNVRVEGGFVSPGESPGLLRILGDYTQTDAGTLLMEVAGPASNETKFDQLQVTGTAALGGKLIVRSIGNSPPSGDYQFLSAGARSGEFASDGSNTQISYDGDGATMQVSGANPPAPKALNIATRMRVETGDNVLIAGFIVTGDQPKRVLVRGIGPSLPVGGALADPTLDLDAGAFFNDDWRSDQQGEIEATSIPPSNDRESAIVATLEPGAHTAVLRGKNGGTGVGLVEVYDLESGTPAQLANISTRGQVQTGDNVMIGGFIIAGDYPAKVLLRAIGPSLPVEGALQDPTLELVDSNGATISNDNWRATQQAEIIETTVPPTNDREAAIVATLVPGAYTAVVRGKDDTVGVALVEGYNLQ